MKSRYNLLKGGKIQLYNLLEDPGETKNLAKEHPEMVAEFDSLMKASRTPSEYFNFSYPVYEVGKVSGSDK